MFYFVRNLDSLYPKFVFKGSERVASVQNQNSFIAAVVDWVGDSIQAVKGVFGRVETKELCVDDVCVTRDQFKAVFDNVGSTASSSPQGSTLDPEKGRTLEITDSVPPVIMIIGNNPALIEQDTSYIDLGATVDDNVDHNLGIHVTGDQIDTSISGSYTVTYIATDQAGNVATSTREVIVSSGGEESVTVEETPSFDISTSTEQ